MWNTALSVIAASSGVSSNLSEFWLNWNYEPLPCLRSSLVLSPAVSSSPLISPGIPPLPAFCYLPSLTSPALFPLYHPPGHIVGMKDHRSLLFGYSILYKIWTALWSIFWTFFRIFRKYSQKLTYLKKRERMYAIKQGHFLYKYLGACSSSFGRQQTAKRNYYRTNYSTCTIFLSIIFTSLIVTRKLSCKQFSSSGAGHAPGPNI